MKVLLSAALVIAIGALVLTLALAPLYERYDAEECRRGYARARTRIDTIAVDFRPYAARSVSGKHRCGEVRALHPGTPDEIPLLRGVTGD